MKWDLEPIRGLCDPSPLSSTAGGGDPRLLRRRL